MCACVLGVNEWVAERIEGGYKGKRREYETFAKQPENIHQHIMLVSSLDLTKC